MLICHCNAVTDRAIRRAVRDGAGSLAELGSACGAGSCCGGCTDAVREILHSEAESHDSIPSVSAPRSIREA